MPKPKLPPATSFKERLTQDWNTTTYHAYLSSLHEKTLNLPYMPFKGGWNAEKRLIKSDFEQYGKQEIKELIEMAFKEYKPTQQYPNLTYGFISTYMKSRILPRIIAKKQQQEKAKEYSEKQTISEDWI